MRRKSIEICAFFLLLLLGCSSAPEKNREYTFYPSPPDKPRIQLLRTISNSRDVEGKEDAFTVFLLGKEKKSIPIRRPYGAAFYENKLYICDLKYGNVMIFDLESQEVSFLEDANRVRHLGKPINIHIDKDGTKYITDVKFLSVVVYDKSDQYMRTYTGFEKPSDVMPAGEKLYVSDTKARTVFVVDKKSGEILKKLDISAAKIVMPVNMTLDSKGLLYIADPIWGKVGVFSPQGEFVKNIGKLGRTIGCLVRPKGLAVDPADRLYIVDAAFQNCQIFLKDGRLAMFFGQPGELNLPTEIVITTEGIDLFKDYISPDFKVEYLIFIVSQGGAAKVTAYGFGSAKT